MDLPGDPTGGLKFFHLREQSFGCRGLSHRPAISAGAGKCTKHITSPIDVLHRSGIKLPTDLQEREASPANKEGADEDLHSQLTELTQQTALLMRQNDELTEQIAARSGEAEAAVAAEAEQVERHAADLQAQHAASRERIEDMTQQMQEQQSQHVADRADLTQRLEKAFSQHDQLSRGLEAAVGEQEQLRQQLQAANNECELLTTQLAAAMSQEEQLHQQILEMESHQGQLISELDTKSAELELEHEHAAVQQSASTVTSLEASLATSQQQLHSRAQESTRQQVIKEASEQLQQQVQDLTARITAQDSELAVTSRQLEALQQANGTAEASLQERASQVLSPSSAMLGCYLH